MVQPCGIAENELIEFQDFLTLVDFMIVDMDPHQQTSIILGKPFLKSVRAIIDKTRGTINMNVDGVHEKFIYHPKNLACCCQIRVHRYPGSRKVRSVEVIPEHMMSHPQPRNKGPKKDVMTPDKEPSAAENFSVKSTRHVKDVTSVATSSPVVLATCCPQWASTDNTIVESIHRPCSSHAPRGWSSLGVPPDLYLIRKVFDVLQLVFCINRHI
jgi:hypothetical protein